MGHQRIFNRAKPVAGFPSRDKIVALHAPQLLG